MLSSRGWKQFNVFTEIESLEIYLRSIELKQCKHGVEWPTRFLRFVTLLHLPFSVGSLDLFVSSLVFIKGTSCYVIRRN